MAPSQIPSASTQRASRQKKPVEHYQAGSVLTDAQARNKARQNAQKRQKKQEARKDLKDAAPVNGMTIYRHIIYPNKANEYVVDYPKAKFEWPLPEVELEAFMIPHLRQYQSRISGVPSKRQDCAYNIEEIVGHREHENTVFYRVKWAAPYTHPIWDSEVLEKDMVKNDSFYQYKAQHNLA